MSNDEAIETADSVRLVATGAVVSSRFLRQYKPIHDDGYYADYPHVAITLRWCLDYWNKHQSAPRGSIMDVFKLREREIEDQDVYELVERFLVSISAEYDEKWEDGFDDSLALDCAETFCRGQKILQLSDRLKKGLERASLDELEEEISHWRPGSNQRIKTHDALDAERLSKTTTDQTQKEVVFEYPGALGELIKPMRRGDFWTLVGPEKRGKTWALMDAALRGFRRGHGVLYVSAGDMDDDDMDQRLVHMLTGVDPLATTFEPYLIPAMDCLWNQIQECPIKDAPSQDAIASYESPKKGKKYGKSELICAYDDDPKHEICIKCSRSKSDKRHFKGAHWYRMHHPHPLSKADIQAATEKMHKQFPGRRDRLRIICTPSDYITVGEIRNLVLDHNDYENLNVGLVVVDYADILASENVRDEFRHQENKKWLKGRSLSAELKTGLIWATQGTKVTYDKDTIEKGDLSEDKRKLGHVTLAIGLNQSEQDMEDGIMRPGVIAARKQRHGKSAQVKVLQSFAAGKFYINSYW